MEAEQMAHGGKLSNAHKLFVLQQLACFETPKDAADALSREYGVTITPQSIERYDPSKKAGARLAERFRALFEETRARFLERLDAIPIANKAVRLQRLEKAYQTAASRGNLVLAAALLEQGAKEMGGALTNRRELTGKDGKPVQFEDVTAMTDVQLEAEYNRLLAKARGTDGDETEKPH